MRLTIAASVLLGAVSAFAADVVRPRVDLDVVVPVSPYEHERLHYFGRRGQLPIPNAVTIDGAAYACDPHKLRFRERDAFAAHLRSKHQASLDRLSDHLTVVDGRVRFVGE